MILNFYINEILLNYNKVIMLKKIITISICLLINGCASLENAMWYDRGFYTVFNAIKSLSKDPTNEGQFPKLTVTTACAPEAKMAQLDKMVAYLQGRDKVTDPKIREEMKVKCS